MTNPVYRLEQLLRFWESEARLREYKKHLATRAFPNNDEERGKWLDWAPAFCPDWRRLRPELMKAHTGDPDLKDLVILDATMEQWENSLRRIPLELLAWMRHSRRVFMISRELQLLLEATDLGDISWRDIPLPFESFVIVLEDPLGTDKKYDALLWTRINFDELMANHKESQVKQQLSLSARILEKLPFGLGKRLSTSQIDKSPIYSLRLLPRNLEYARPSSNSLAKIKFRLKDLRRAKKTLERIKRELDKLSDVSLAFSSINEALLDIPITESFWQSPGKLWRDQQKMLTDSGALDEETSKLLESSGEILANRQTEFSEMDRAAGIVAGLCLYLSTLPGDSPYLRRSLLKRPSKSVSDSGVDLRAITLENEIFEVSNSHKIEPELLKAMRQDRDQRAGTTSAGARRAVRAHFRRGHWRRPKGRGHDPEAEKTVWVSPTLVGSRRLKKGCLASSSESSIGFVSDEQD